MPPGSSAHLATTHGAGYPTWPAPTLDGVSPDAGRTWHYRDFYRPAGTPPAEDLPAWLVVGNCQAEALRLVLDSVPQRPYRTVRMPPVHELEAADLPHLARVLAETAVLLCQPIRANYRGLPIGTSDLTAALPPAATTIRWPVLRYAGLYPFQVIVRDPADRAATPPTVPYHDLRTLAAARDGSGPADDWDVEVTAVQIRAVGDASVAELAYRENRDTDVGVSDALRAFGGEAAHTINHPGNPVLVELANRILALRGVSARAVNPPRTLLSSVYAPLDPRVVSALGLADNTRPAWRVGEQDVSAQSVHENQLAWYTAHPDYIRLARERHGAAMDLLGLSRPRSSR